MKYLVIVLSMSLFVIGFVWQNIEVVKLKMEYRRLQTERAEAARENDRLRCEIQELSSLKRLENAALSLGMRPIEPGDVHIIGKEAK